MQRPSSDDEVCNLIFDTSGKGPADVLGPLLDLVDAAVVADVTRSSNGTMLEG